MPFDLPSAFLGSISYVHIEHLPFTILCRQPRSDDVHYVTLHVQGCGYASFLFPSLCLMFGITTDHDDMYA